MKIKKSVSERSFRLEYAVRGLTQTALAKSLGVSSNAVSAIESGRLKLSGKLSELKRTFCKAGRADGHSLSRLHKSYETHLCRLPEICACDGIDEELIKKLLHYRHFAWYDRFTA